MGFVSRKSQMIRRLSIKKGFQLDYVTVGKLVLLSGVLVAAFLLSLILGMRLAVSGNVLETPVLVGMSLEDAERVFSSVELDLVVGGERYDAQIPAGAIIDQKPGPGVGIKAGRAVRVIVSLGRRTNAVPNLQGVSLRAARLLAAQNGFEIGRISEISLSDEDETIIRQSPAPFSEDTVDDQVDVLVLKKRVNSYVMPDVITWNLNKALIFLEGHGFETRVFYRRHSGVQRGTIVRQFPEPGFRLNEEDMINLEVAR
jgi:serine/threonine-protein kinase